ncbi:hypothetical protein BD560DRAFT_459964 [Blakeslea trispora]|nr:hypothetical protein BD560DRAFT_459964 [Blakeslea trispora]
MYQTAQQIADSLHEPGSNMELVSFGSDSSLHREDIWKLSEKDGDPMGHEQLNENGHILVSFAKREPNRLSQEDFECLQAYYNFQYETPLIVTNKVQKIKKMQVLGHEYRSRLTGRDEGAHIYAYRANNIETDDLEGVRDTGDEEHLRAGIIEYFFLHETDYHENGEIFSTKHCFAFVSWYKNPRINIDNVETGTTERIRPFRKEYERKSFRSILPVHKLYLPIHIRHSEIKHLFTAYPLTRRLA